MSLDSTLSASFRGNDLVLQITAFAWSGATTSVEESVAQGHCLLSFWGHFATGILKMLQKALSCCAKCYLLIRIWAGGVGITQAVPASPGSSEVSSKCQLSPPSLPPASPEFQLQKNFWWVWDSVRQCLKQIMVLGLHLPKPVLNRSDLHFLTSEVLRQNPFLSRKSSFFCFVFVLFCV